jgi:hypothetical protein
MVFFIYLFTKMSEEITTTRTLLVIIAMVAAVGLLGVIAMESISVSQQYHNNRWNLNQV